MLSLTVCTDPTKDFHFIGLCCESCMCTTHDSSRKDHVHSVPILTVYPEVAPKRQHVAQFRLSVLCMQAAGDEEAPLTNSREEDDLLEMRALPSNASLAAAASRPKVQHPELVRPSMRWKM